MHIHFVELDEGSVCYGRLSVRASDTGQGRYCPPWGGGGVCLSESNSYLRRHGETTENTELL